MIEIHLFCGGGPVVHVPKPGWIGGGGYLGGGEGILGEFLPRSIAPRARFPRDNRGSGIHSPLAFPTPLEIWGFTPLRSPPGFGERSSIAPPKR